MRTHTGLWTALLTVVAALAAGEKRHITEVDLYRFQWIADAQISPDGSRVIYALTNVAAKHDNYETALWVIPSAGGSARQLTSGPRDSGARWSPDGKLVAFTRSLEKDGKDGKPQPPQIWLLSMDGGEARPLTDMPKGAGEIVWSPDGRHVAFASTSLVRDFQKKPPAEAEAESDVRVITGAGYRMNGAGYRDAKRPSHIWVVEVPAVPGSMPSPRQVTSGDFAESDAVWSRDGSRLYFTSDRRKEAEFLSPHNDLYSVDAMTGAAATKLASMDGRIEGLSLSPDGKRMAFTGEINRVEGKPERSYDQPDLFVSGVEPGSKPRNLTASYDFDIGSGPGGDQGPPRGGSRAKPWWSSDGRSIMVVSAEEGKANLKRVDADTGTVSPVTDGDFAVYSWSATPDGSKAAALISTTTNVGDLFLVDLNAKSSIRQLTHINGDLFSHLDLTEPEMIWYKSFDGRPIQAWVQRPPDFQSGRKYPLILNIHGGPHAAYGYVFDHEIQWMAAKGYVVLYPNPRGSTTYGQDFGNIIQYRYPGDDYTDLMAGVDELIKRGWVDPDKLGVTGGSGGGVLTNWTIGHTGRFKAAVSQRSIADWGGWWYGADIIAPTWFRGAPWESEADFKARSPISYVQKISTPLMLIEGESDDRTPPAYGGEQMFRALKYLKKPVVMVRFPGETHELSRSGKPVHRVERLQHIVAWFDKYLQGQDVRTYDLN